MIFKGLKFRNRELSNVSYTLTSPGTKVELNKAIWILRPHWH